MKNEISAAGNLIQIISQSRQNALKKVNEELIQMYWKVGEYLSTESTKVSFGDAYIDTVAEEVQNAFPGIKGFNRRGLYRMKKFYETYADDLFVTTLLSQISWSNHLAIISKAKTPEERHFYITLCIKENYSARELSRQIDSGYYERYMLSKEKLLPEPIKGLKENPFLDSYVFGKRCSPNCEITDRFAFELHYKISEKQRRKTKQVLASVKVPALLCREFRTSGYSKNGCGSRSGICLAVKKADG